MSYVKKCKQCGKKFVSERYTAKFCSQSCYARYKRTEANRIRLERILEHDPDCGAYLKDGIVMYRRNCVYCGREFHSVRADSRYCSRQCHDADVAFRKRRSRSGSLHAKAMADIDCAMKGKTLNFRRKCEYCGREFIAQKVSTRFCSSSCARKYRTLQKRKNVSPDGNPQVSLPSLSEGNSPYLQLSEVADILSVSRTTVYRYIQKGILESISLPGLIRVPRSCLEKLRRPEIRFYVHKGANSDTRPDFVPNPVIAAGEDLISITEACELYKLDPNKARFMIRRSGLNFVRFRNVRFYNRDELHRFLSAKVRASHPEITDWCSVEEIMQVSGRTRRAVYNLVYSHQEIPRRKEGGKTWYSRSHILSVLERGEGEDLSAEYYTSEEAAERYRMTREKLYKVVSRLGLRKKTVRGRLWISKEDLDSLMSLNGPDSSSQGHFF